MFFGWFTPTVSGVYVSWLSRDTFLVGLPPLFVAFMCHSGIGTCFWLVYSHCLWRLCVKAE